MPPSKARIITALALAASGLLVLGASPAQAAATQLGAFNPLDQPARLADPVVVPAKGSNFVNVAGQGGVPSMGSSPHAGAVVLNVTVDTPGARGYVTAYPTGGSPGGTSSVNFYAGRTIANHVTVQLGNDGNVALYNGSSAAVKVKVDVTGWYVAGSGTAPGMFTPIPPKRILDKTTVAAHATKAVTGSAAVSIPSGKGAGAFNLTVSSPTASGYVSAHPNNIRYSASNPPGFSNLNFKKSQEIANAATVKLSNGAALFNGSSGSSVLLADVAGWFNTVNGTPTDEGAFVPVDPARLMDTRYGVGGVPKTRVPAGGKVTLIVGGRGGVPAALASAVVLNVTATNATASGYVTAYPAGLDVNVAKKTSTVNFVAGDTIPNLATVKLSADGKVSFYNGSTQPVDILADVSGWYRNTQRADVPAGVLNLAKWKVTLPVDGSDAGTDADEVKQPTLAGYELSPWFEDITDSNGHGVRFRANAGGATTSGSTNPRSELREMEGDGTVNAGWSSTNGKTHIMTITQAITALPAKKPQVVAGQIHDGGPSNGGVGDIIVVRLNGTNLIVKAGLTDTTVGTLDSNYQLGTKFRVEFRADGDGVRISYWRPDTAASPTKVVTYTPNSTELAHSWFFKAGCYTQSNMTSETDPNTYGEVVIYDVTVEHR